MYEWMHKCMKTKKGKENVSSRWWFRWWSDWAKRCYPIKIMWLFTEPIFIDLFFIYIITNPNKNRIMQDPIMKIILFTWPVLKNHRGVIMVYTISNKRMWLGGMIDLGLRLIGSWTITNSKNQPWVRESVLVQELRPNQKIEIDILFLLMECDYPN